MSVKHEAYQRANVGSTSAYLNVSEKFKIPHHYVNVLAILISQRCRREMIRMRIRVRSFDINLREESPYRQTEDLTACKTDEAK